MASRAKPTTNKAAPAPKQVPKPRMANNNIQRMQYSQKAKKGTRFDPSERWGQTPATSNQIAPRGFGYYDAFTEDAYSAITAMSIGPATPITAKCVLPVITTKPSLTLSGGASLEAGFIMIVVYPSSSPSLAYQYTCSSANGTDIISVSTFQAPALRADPPESLIPARCSFTLKNISEHFTMGGDVYTLRCTTGLTLLPNLSTNLELATFASDVRVHARAKNYDGVELKVGHQKNCTVVDQAKATWFANFDVSHTSEDQPWLRPIVNPAAQPTFRISPFTQGIHDPSFTPIVLLFDPFVSGIAQSAGSPIGNSYRMIVQAQYLAHYPQGGMLANMAIEPKSSPSAMERYRALENRHGSDFHMLKEVAGKVIQQAWKHRQEIAMGVRSVGKLW